VVGFHGYGNDASCSIKAEREIRGSFQDILFFHVLTHCLLCVYQTSDLNSICKCENRHVCG
jgi:hypothetical protein